MGSRKRNKIYNKLYQRDLAKGRLLAEEGRHRLVIVIDNLKGNFNVGKIYRTAEAFSIREIHLVNIPFFNPVPAKGTLRKVKTRLFDHFEESYRQLKDEGYTLYAFDSRSEAVLGRSPLPVKTAVIVGHEYFGLSFDVRAYPDIVPIRVPMYGQTESLNVSVAASVGMYQYIVEHGL